MFKMLTGRLTDKTGNCSEKSREIYCAFLQTLSIIPTIKCYFPSQMEDLERVRSNKNFRRLRQRVVLRSRSATRRNEAFSRAWYKPSTHRTRRKHPAPGTVSPSLAENAQPQVQSRSQSHGKHPVLGTLSRSPTVTPSHRYSITQSNRKHPDQVHQKISDPVPQKISIPRYSKIWRRIHKFTTLFLGKI